MRDRHLRRRITRTWNSILFLVLMSGCTYSLNGVNTLLGRSTPSPPDNPQYTIAEWGNPRTSHLRDGGIFPTSIPILPSSPYDGSVLTQLQKERLYWVSTQYAAGTQSESMDIARLMDFAGVNSHPSNMCGPLAVALMSDAGIISPYIDLHDFWNLDPRPDVDEKLMERTFPRDKYLWIRVNTRLDEVNYSDFPLYTGDFVYLYSGYEGSFEHVLVVTRVDESGRVYSTTNLRNEDQEYLIKEVLLYDPKQPGEGMFYHWTNQDNFDTGITGFGGLQLWRPLNPIAEPDSKQIALAIELDNIISEAGGDWNVVVKEVGGDIIYNRRGDTRIHTASVAKIPLAMLFFHTIEIYAKDIDREWLDHTGTGGRSYSQLLEAMLVQSEEDAASILEDWVTTRVAPRKVLTEWGFPQMSLTPRRATALEMAELFEGLYEGKWISSFGRNTILGFLSEYTPNDENRLGSLNNHLPAGSVVFNKRGSLANGQVIVADVALVVIEERVYVLAFFSRPNESPDATFDTLETAIEAAATAFWEVYGK